MTPEKLELIFSILEYVIAALLGYTTGRWKNVLVFLADLIPILRRVLPPVYNTPTNPSALPELRWAQPAAEGMQRIARPVSGAWIV